MIKEPSDFGGLFVCGGGATVSDLARHPNLEIWSRVIVVGANGAGKTWVSNAMAARTQAALIHKDALVPVVRLTSSTDVSAFIKSAGERAERL